MGCDTSIVAEEVSVLDNATSANTTATSDSVDVNTNGTDINANTNRGNIQNLPSNDNLLNNNSSNINTNPNSLLLSKSPPAIPNIDNSFVDKNTTTVVNNNSDSASSTSSSSLPYTFNNNQTRTLEGTMLGHPVTRFENQSSLSSYLPESSLQSNAITNYTTVPQGLGPDHNTRSGEIGITTPPTTTPSSQQQLSPQTLPTTPTTPSSQQQLSPQTLPTTPTTPSSQQQLSPQTLPTTPAYPLDITPPDTIITSAIDNNTGMNIQNTGTAALNSITFTFEGVDDSGIAGYMCMIENLQAFPCSSPVIFDTSILQAGGIGNTAIFLDTPSKSVQ